MHSSKLKMSNLTQNEFNQMQYSQIIPTKTLQNSEKIIFIIHLAIGDFTYMQNGFKAFKEKYPHIKIDLFILESRCTEEKDKWPFLKNYVLYDWLENCGYFNKIYRENYSPQLLKKSIKEAQSEQYPIVVTLGTLLSEPIELMGREIAGKNLLIGLKVPIKWYKFKYKKIKKNSWKNLDLAFYSKKLLPGEHISQVYNSWFQQLAGISLTYEERLPFVDIPKIWLLQAKDYIDQYKREIKQPNAQTIFINNIAKDPKRSWSFDQTATLIKLLQADARWQHAIFIINTIPEHKKLLKKHISEHGLSQCLAFSATNNFYELPAMLSICNFIVSVETSIIHLANAVKVPVIALMRQRTPDWEPLNKQITTVIWCKNKKDNIVDISPIEVSNVIREKFL